MKSFQFPLQRVLDWRALQMRSEEEKLTVLQHRLSLVVQREAALTAAEMQSAMGLRRLEAVSGAELQAMSAFQLYLKSERKSLLAKRAQCEQHIADQRRRLLKARRDCKVLEKLKEKRLKAWTYESDREVEDTAAESFIARWSRAEDEVA